MHAHACIFCFWYTVRRAMHFFSLKNRVFGVVVALAFVLSLNLFSGNVRGFFAEALSPMQGFFWGFGSASSHFFSGLFNAASLKKENIQLEERMLRLSQ